MFWLGETTLGMVCAYPGLAPPIRARRPRFVQTLLFDVVYKNSSTLPPHQSHLLTSLPTDFSSSCFLSGAAKSASPYTRPYFPVPPPIPPALAASARWPFHFQLAGTAHIPTPTKQADDAISPARASVSSPFSPRSFEPLRIRIPLLVELHDLPRISSVLSSRFSILGPIHLFIAPSHYGSWS